VVSAARKVSERPVSFAIDLSGVSVLVADNERGESAAIRRHCEEAGSPSVLTTYSGRQALKLVMGHRPDLVILSSRLSSQDGYRVCHQIKDNEGLGFVPIILLIDPHEKAYAEEEDCGADAVLTRPIDPADLLAQMRALLRIKAQFDRLSEQNQRLATLSQRIELFKFDIIRNVSHELATPLLQAKSAVHALVEDVRRGETRGPTASTVSEMAVQSVGRLEGMIDNVRQFAQAHDIQVGPVLVDEAVDLAIRHVGRSWAWRDSAHRVVKRIEDDLPLVLADKRAMARLFQLLIDNALKFSPPDSPVIVEAYRTNDDQVWIGVQDFGIGIPAEEQTRIFEAFYQIDASTTRRYGGIGIGLALALLFADGMETKIEVDSKPGAGSTFWFLLPAIALQDIVRY
jgi:signal transduction histidine kinase